MSRKASLVLFVVLIASLAPRRAALEAQSGAAPAVSRRTVDLTGGVWPGDFNGDGIVDLVSTSRTPAIGFKPIVIAIGKGDGTFNAPASIGTNGGVLATGDFDNDGRLDLVVSADEDDAPLRMLRGNGDGTFGQPVRIGGAVVVGLPFAEVADFDGDGNSDLAIGYIGESDDSGVLIYQGLGDGTFTEVIARLNTGDGSGPNGAVVADLNGDGRKDVVVANHFSKSLSIFLNQGSFVFTASDRQMAYPSNDVAAADVNGDGKLDLIVAESFSRDGDVSYESGTVVVYLGNGDGTIATFGHFYSTGRGTWRVVTGDFNRDGVLDIATANRSAIAVDDCGPRYKTWDSISVITGHGDGTFTVSGSNEFSLTNQSNLDEPRYRNNVWSLATADVNGDGAADLVVSDGVIFVNNPPDPNWAPTVSAGPDRLFSGSHTVTLRAIADDVDQDLLYYAWSSDANISIPNVPNPCITVPRDGTFTFTVTVTDMHGHYAWSTVHYSFSGDGGDLFVYPAVTVTAPTTGEVVQAGSPYTIRWTAEAGTYPISRFNVLFSSDGATVSNIPGCTNLPPSAKSCQWTNPSPPTETAYVQVETISTSGPSLTVGTGRFSVRGTTSDSLPNGWSHGDVGSVGAAGTASYDGSVDDGDVVTVSGSGADIWGTADELHYVWKSMFGNFEINTRVNSVDAVNAWTKAGLMVRANATDASSPHVSLFATPGKGIAFQRRTTAGGTSISTPGPAYTAPVYLRLVRDGINFFAYYRKNPTDPWKLLAQQTMSMGSTVDVGMAVTSHADGSVATAKFQGVRVAALPAWSTAAIGEATGSASITNGTNYTVNGSGADIWGTSDGLEYLWAPLSGSGRITARVLSVQNVHAWTKAGVMIRESLAADAKQVDAFVTPGKGFAMQYRDAAGGTSVSAGQKAGVAPAWVRLERVVGWSSDFVQAYYSTDLQVWRLLGQLNLTMSKDVYIGLAVSSHNAGTEATATFEDVRVDRY
jgi:VCBS repeat protein